MSAWRGRLRRLSFGLSTVLGLSRRGYFIPYRYAGSSPEAGSLLAYGPIEKILSQAAPEIAQRLTRAAGYLPELRAIGKDAEPPQPRWNQSWYPRLDAAIAYSLVRDLRPKRIVEVGSGHSTRFLARAAADAGTACEITAIDPAPRADLGRLPVRLLRKTLQEAGFEPFRPLASGDLLLVDSSHILMPGSDVDFLLGRVLPNLPAGLRMAFHDIFLPDDYPASWAWRGYNEQQGIAALLQGGAWRPLFSSRYVLTRMPEVLAESGLLELPLPPGAHESVLWLERVSRENDGA